MIKYKDTILEEFFIDPITAIITNSKGEIQKTYILNGRPYFKGHGLHQWQLHTHIGYQKVFDIHHIDENKFNNSLSNLVYLTRSEHAKIHNKIGKKLSEETKLKIGKASKGRRHSEETKRKLIEVHKGKKLSEETKKKMSESRKGKKHPLYGKRYKWINNGVENRFIPLDDEIPEGFIHGRLKCKIS